MYTRCIMREALYPPPVAAALANSLRVGFGLGLAVGNQRNDEYKAEGANCKQNPQCPAEASPVLCFYLGYGLHNDVGAAALFTPYLVFFLYSLLGIGLVYGLCTLHAKVTAVGVFLTTIRANQYHILHT